MAKLTAVTANKVVLLFWGPPKSGKTILASQFPNITFVDLDDGVGSVLSMRNDLGLTFDFDVYNPADTSDEEVKKIIGASMASQSPWIRTKKLVEVAAKKLTRDETLVIDNLSRIGEQCYDHCASTTGVRPLQIKGWMHFSDEIQALCSYIRNAKCNVIIIAHEDYQTDEATNETFRQILMQSKMRYRIPSIVSDFLYMKSVIQGNRANREVHRFLQAVADPKTAVGSRSLIPDMLDPTYAKIKPYLEIFLNRELGEPTWTPPAPKSTKSPLSGTGTQDMHHIPGRIGKTAGK